MDDAFARELERLASDCLEESKRHWVARGARPEAHSDDPAVTVTAVEVTVIDGVGTVHVRFVDDRYPGERFGARLRVPPVMEHEGPRATVLPMIAGHVLTALGEVTWAGGHPLSRPVHDDGVRWFTGDVI